LISPVSPSGENAGVQNALDEYCKGSFSIKIPAKGSYTTSFIFHDFNVDSHDEAIAFYEPSNNLGSVRLAFLVKNNDKWSVQDNINGEATDVNSVDFCDLNNDGIDEIIVCWSVVSKAVGFKVNVYAQDKKDGGSLELKKLSDSVSASDFICIDLNSDGSDELLTLANNAVSDSARAQLYTYTGGKRKLLGTTRIDSSISSFSNISVGKLGKGIAVYADGIKSDGSSMVTELILWSDYYDSIISPFYSYSTGKTSGTSRNMLINSKDIDSDGTVEIPSDATIKDLPSELSAQNWKKYKDSVLIHKCYSIACRRDNFILLIPDDLFGKIKVSYNSDKRETTVSLKSKDKELFKIATVLKSGYDGVSDKFSDYTEIFSDSGFVYLAKVNKKANKDITIDDLKDMIKEY
jgi:hypothetical protein